MGSLLTPRELDRLLRYPRGRSMKLARAGKLPHIVLPDGEVRFDEDEITALLKQPKSEQEAAHA
jgi:predicted site-specific integrase-resolvase